MVAVRLDRRVGPACRCIGRRPGNPGRRFPPVDDYLRDQPLPFLGWLRQLAGERVVKDRTGTIVSRSGAASTARARTPSFPTNRPLSSADSSWRRHQPQQSHDAQELRDPVMAALAELSPRDREVLVMRHFEQLGTAEIAEALGITEAGVKVRLLRALARSRLM